MAVVLLGLLLADTLVAARAEHTLSRRIAATANLEVAPAVTLGGTGFLGALRSQEISYLGVESRDIPVANFGLINSRTEAIDLDFSTQENPTEKILAGDISGVPAELLIRRLIFDGVAVGNQLGITDLDLAHPTDISPTGGSSAEVILSGTPAGFNKPVKVLATLRLKGPQFHMKPIQLITGPPEKETEIFQLLDWQLDTRNLPLGSTASRVYISGGSITFESQTSAVILDINQLSPRVEPDNPTGT
ncbi:LmeA family phospholipid-binding protein [Corynebacterium caspium]|uniref:LmeA family phospholipid-binding protein n=1 Tax=Corynebacterium caspium TaxID=234828 RepID=UPI0003614EC0|nr:DUF2993 domain-containing protein [Corynebacterium caspium]WKD58754.1 hypothetical protein CCASP_01645 [Corynebacterium caspium DSM 44850]